MTPASRTPSTRLPPGELSRIPETGRPELVDALMMFLSRLASPSASSPIRVTIVRFSLDNVVVSSAADADQHAATTHTTASMPLNTAVFHPQIRPVRTITPACRCPQSLVDNFVGPRGSVAVFRAKIDRHTSLQ